MSLMTSHDPLESPMPKGTVVPPIDRKKQRRLFREYQVMDNPCLAVWTVLVVLTIVIAVIVRILP